MMGYQASASMWAGTLSWWLRTNGFIDNFQSTPKFSITAKSEIYSWYRVVNAFEVACPFLIKVVAMAFLIDFADK